MGNTEPHHQSESLMDELYSNYLDQKSNDEDGSEALSELKKKCDEGQVKSCHGKCEKEEDKGLKIMNGCVAYCLRLQEAAEQLGNSYEYYIQTDTP